MKTITLELLLALGSFRVGMHVSLSMKRVQFLTPGF